MKYVIAYTLVIQSLSMLSLPAAARKSDLPFSNGWQIGSISGPMNGIGFIRASEWEIIDLNANTVGSNRFDSQSEFCNGAAVVLQNGKYGLIDTAGKFLIKPKYDHLGNLSDGLIPFLTSGASMTGYIGPDGRCKIPPAYIIGKDFSDGIAAVEDPDKQRHFIDRQGHSILQINFKAAGFFSEGLAPIKIGDSWGFVDKAGSMVIPAEYHGAKSLHEKLAPVENAEGLWGYIDRHGGTKIPFKFREADEFSEGLARVETDPGQYFFIDRHGRKRLGPFAEAGRFGDGVAPILYRPKQTAYISKSGKILYLGKFQCVGSFRNGRAFVMRED